MPPSSSSSSSSLPPPPPGARSPSRERAAGGRMLQTAAEADGWAGMKRPLSPSHSPENSLQLVEVTSCPPGPPEQRMKREKKHQSFTLCEVCNIQLNSAAQAQIHYNGKSHQKRLKQLNKGKMPAAQGPSGHSSPLLASLPIPGRPLHSPLDIKHFLTFRLNGTSPLNLFPNFNTMDPVQKAVISHTFGVPAPLKKKQFISCNICHLRFNSANQAEAHYKGHKHARRLKAIEAMKSKQKAAGAVGGDSTADFTPCLEGDEDPSSAVPPSDPKEADGDGPDVALPPGSEQPPAETPGSAAPLGSPPPSEPSEAASDAASVTSSAAHGPEAQAAESGSSGSAPDSEKEGRKGKQHLYCPTCKVTVNSLSQLEAHNTGAKHKSMLEGHSAQLRRGRGKLLARAGHKAKRIGNKGSINIQNKAFHCQVCEIYVNSETQLKQHMSSRRHKDRLAGKPPKPKYSPYNKLQKNAALASKLALQKHLTKTLATRFLPSPLTTAVCAMPGPLALRPAAATTLFQAPILGPALFRTPPAHVRTTPGPIVFAPY
ncbi:zinc finger protein 385C isoform X1 [Coturnix japonica]|nr:zinc finger protein 385C isoform X1 [Coturnix japonica]